MTSASRLFASAILALCFACSWGAELIAQNTEGAGADATELASAADAQTPENAPENVLSEAQSEQYELWLQRANAAQQVVDDPNSSNALLQSTREQMVGYRDAFSKLRADNAERIKTLKSQSETLGPEPKTGSEPEQVAAIRARLKRELNALLVPVILAEESRIRASGLIQEIDTILNDRLRVRLLRRDPVPFSWTTLSQVADDLERTNVFVIEEIRALMATPPVMDDLQRRGPLLVFLGLVSAVLIVYGTRLGSRISLRLIQISPRASLLWGYIESILRVGLPFLGVLLLVWVLRNTGVFGLRSTLLLDAMPKWGALLIGFTWLSHGLFGRRGGNPYFSVTPIVAAQMHVLAIWSAVALILMDFVEIYETVEVVSQATVSAFGFPVIVFQALTLFRIQQIAFTAERGGVDDDSGIRDNLPLLRRLMVGVLVLCICAGALGYVELAGAIVFALTYSLMLIGFLLILQKGAGDFWAGLLGADQETGRDQLLTAVTSILFWIISLPFFAIIWGARPGQLSELWTHFLDGIQIGDTQISPTIFVSLALIFAIGVLMTRVLQSTLANRLLPKTRIDPGGQAAIVSGIGYVGFGIASLVAVTGAGLDLSSVAIVAGALSVGIGFGLQTIVSNFVSGIILLIERPVSKGDWISVAGNMGYVRDISVRSTRIETFDRTDVIIPNSDLISGTVVNYTHGNTVGRVIVPVGVAYGTDTRKVEAILGEVANAHPMVLANPAPSVVFQGFGADSLDFEIRAILRDVNWVLSVKSDMNHDIARRFAENGIEIPFSQRDIWLRNPEVLQGGSEFAGTSRHNFTHEEASTHLDLDDMDPDPEGNGDGPR